MIKGINRKVLCCFIFFLFLGAQAEQIEEKKLHIRHYGVGGLMPSGSAGKKNLCWAHCVKMILNYYMEDAAPSFIKIWNEGTEEKDEPISLRLLSYMLSELGQINTEWVERENKDACKINATNSECVQITNNEISKIKNELRGGKPIIAGQRIERNAEKFDHVLLITGYEDIEESNDNSPHEFNLIMNDPATGGSIRKSMSLFSFYFRGDLKCSWVGNNYITTDYSSYRPPLAKGYCPIEGGGLKKISAEQNVEYFCGNGGCVATDDCSQMIACINKDKCEGMFNFVNDYDQYSAHFKEGMQPEIMLVENEQTCLVEIDVSNERFNDDYYEVHFDYLFSTDTWVHKLSDVGIEHYLTVNIYVDNEQVSSINVFDEDLKYEGALDLHTKKMHVEDLVYIKNGNQKVQLLFKAGGIKNENCNNSLLSISDITINFSKQADPLENLSDEESQTSSGTSIPIIPSKPKSGCTTWDFGYWEKLHNYEPCYGPKNPNTNMTFVDISRWRDACGSFWKDDKVRIDWGDGETVEIEKLNDGAHDWEIYRGWHWHQYKHRNEPYTITVSGREFCWNPWPHWAWTGYKKWASVYYHTIEMINGVPASDIYAYEKGEILKGLPPYKAIPLRSVKLAGKWLMVGKYEVTQREYMQIMGTVPFKNWGLNKYDYPAENLTIYDAILFCNALSQYEGYQEVYTYSDAKMHYKYNMCLGLTNLEADFNKSGYRLPTYEEYKSYYSGNQSLNSNGCYWNDGKVLSNAWSKENSNGTTQKVGLKEPNSCGLHDLGGNVWEWIWIEENEKSIARQFSNIPGTYNSSKSHGFDRNYCVGGSIFESGTDDETDFGINGIYEYPFWGPGFRVVRKCINPAQAAINLLLLN